MIFDTRNSSILKAGGPLLLICLFALASCSLSGSKNNHKGQPDIHGKIVFSAKDDNGISQIYTMRANGTHLKQLTHFNKYGRAADPVWSPDGSLIAFSGCVVCSTIGQYLFVMNADGSNRHHLNRDIKVKGSYEAVLGEDPAWSPDGTKIAYDRCINCELGGLNSEIYYVTVKGNSPESHQVHRVTKNPSSDLYPAWSPDGKKIAFSSDRSYAPSDKNYLSHINLYVTNENGTNLLQLTNSGLYGYSVWLNSNQLLLVLGYRPGINHKSLYILNLKTHKRTPLIKHLDILNTKSVPAVSWDTNHSLLSIISHKEGKLPVIVTIFDLQGHKIEQYKLHSELLKHINGIDFYIKSK